MDMTYQYKRWALPCRHNLISNNIYTQETFIKLNKTTIRKVQNRSQKRHSKAQTAARCPLHAIWVPGGDEAEYPSAFIMVPSASYLLFLPSEFLAAVWYTEV